MTDSPEVEIVEGDALPDTAIEAWARVLLDTVEAEAGGCLGER